MNVAHSVAHQTENLLMLWPALVRTILSHLLAGKLFRGAYPRIVGEIT